ncbi:glutathione S-transferase family protein [Novosphingobium bradum]|uniref:Glutathione S-transferase family protein n=1 Tax=Novosphingobium bradum TaxID=1737444 RepID=A0ABV7IQ21_9SPHN
MKLYGALLSPFVRKVAVVCAVKGIAYELRPFRNRDGFLPEFLAASPFGRIPAIDDDGFVLADSSAIVHYIEAKWPQPPVIPADPQLRGRAMWFEELMDAELSPAGLKVLFNRYVGPVLRKVPGDEALAREGEAQLPRGLDYLEQVVPDEGWLVGDSFTVADISVAAILCSLVTVGLGPSAARPRTLAWYRRVEAHPAWAAVAATEDAARK